MDGRLDLTAVRNVLRSLWEARFSGLVIVRSTLGIGSLREMRSEFPSLRLVYSPEFIRERSAYQWTVCPDRVVLSGEPTDVEAARAIFATWVEDAPVLVMTDAEAEVGKLAHNAYIAVKVAFTNQVEDIARQAGADPWRVMGVIHADRRVRSSDHLQPLSQPFGGKCVPKDTRELASATSAPVLDAVLAFNEGLKRMAEGRRDEALESEPAEP